MTAQHAIPSLAAALLVVRVCLGGVFAVAGLSKLRDPRGTWSMLRSFGAGVRLSDVLARVLPMVEIATAAALVPTASARYGACSALALLTVFTAAIGWNLVRGRRPDCRCFGQLTAAPVGMKTIARNVVFASPAVAALVWPAGDTDRFALASMLASLPLAAAVIGGVALIAQGFVLWQVLQQQGRLLLRIDQLEARPSPFVAHEQPAGLPIGAPAPAFELPTAAGEIRTLASLLAAGKRLAVIFLHPTCGPCRALVADVVRWEAEFAPALTTVVISEGSVADNRTFLAGFPPTQILLQTEHATADAYLSYGTPAAVLIEPDGTIGSAVAPGADAITALLDEARRYATVHPPADGNRIVDLGRPAPQFTALTASGDELQLAHLRGDDIGLIFWSPNCGYCRQAVDDVVAWERESSLRLVVVSPEIDGELIERGFKGPLILDAGSHIGPAFGAAGTPMAIRIDAAGAIASELAVGRDAIEALLVRSS